MRVHIKQSFDDDWIEILKTKLDPEVRLTSSADTAEFNDYEILVTGRPDESDLTASSDLHTVVIPWTGLPIAARELLIEHPELRVFNIHHNAAPTAEMAITLLLAAARDLVAIDGQFRRRDWNPLWEQDRSILMEGGRAVVVGVGEIGRRVARVCDSLGMTVRVVRRRPDRESEFETYPPDRLVEALHDATALIVCVPLSPHTEGMVRRKELAALPDGAIVVNVARGKIIDEKALFDELTAGRLRAGLDVWYQYPREEASRTTQAPSDYPFEKLPNVIMTPHIGGNCRQIESMRAEALAQLLNKMVRNQPLPEPLDIERGY